MLMTHTAEHTRTTFVAHTSENVPTPKEVSRRVNQVRSSWDQRERAARRREAEDRLASLVDLLAVVEDECRSFNGR